MWCSKRGRSVGALLLAVSFLLLSAGSPALALTQNDLNSINNNTAFFDPTASTSGNVCGSATTVLVGSDVVAQVFNFFTGKGLTAIQAAGIVGNLYEESGGISATSQQNGSSSQVPIPNVGFGIAQWTTPSRQQALVDFAAKAGKPVTDLAVQLDFLWQELTTDYSTVLQHVQAATTIEDATNQFMGPIVLSGGSRGGGFENPGKPAFDVRLKDANMVLSQYGGSAASGCSAVDCTAGGQPAEQSGGLSQVRQNVVCIARQELATWKAGVQKNTYCAKYINGLGKPAGDGQWCEEWCADFASWVYDQAKYPLQPDPNWRVGLVDNIRAIGEQNQNFHYHDAASYTPRPGDLVIHQDGESHVNIVESVSGKTLTMIGGDQGGPNYGGPDSTSAVSEYQVQGFSGVDGISGYVSPD